MRYGYTICYGDIGVRIMKLRKEKGYSREQLAELANISASFLYEIETSKKGLSVNSLVGLNSTGSVREYYFRNDKKIWFKGSAESGKIAQNRV